jgi:hypothetical protein
MEPEEAEQDGRHSAIEHRPEASTRVSHEIGRRHLARHQKRDRPSEEAQEVPAAPAIDMIAAVPPPGTTEAGNAKSFVVPYCMKRNAALMRRMLSVRGAQALQRVVKG